MGDKEFKELEKLEEKFTYNQEVQNDEGYSNARLKPR